MGYFYVHGSYPTLSATDAIQLPTSPGYAGNTKYFMFLTQDLPLLQPIRDIPYAGPPIADIFQPALRVMVDLGYSDYGYADLPTPAGLINIPNPFNVAYSLCAKPVDGTLRRCGGNRRRGRLLGTRILPGRLSLGAVHQPRAELLLRPSFSQPPVTALSTAQWRCSATRCTSFRRSSTRSAEDQGPSGAVVRIASSRIKPRSSAVLNSAAISLAERRPLGRSQR